MRYKTAYKESYTDGIVNKSFTITKVALDMLEENEIDNVSAFVNDLIIDALQEKDFFKKKLISQITNCRDELDKKYGFKTLLQVMNDDKKE